MSDQLTVEQSNAENPVKYRILSLDGGGFRGVFSAAMLIEVEKAIREINPHKRLNDYFDCIAGTSTGALLAAGIALGISSEKLLEFYKNNGKRIFPSRIRWLRQNLRITSNFFPISLYRHEYCWNKKEGLPAVLRDELHPTEFAHLREAYKPGSPVTMRDIVKPDLLIPAYSLNKRALQWFVSNSMDNDPFFWYNDISLQELCVCSASAPTFFPPFELTKASNSKEAFVDGGLSANNPVLLAIVQSMLNYNRKTMGKALRRQEISVLSVGTGRITDALSYDQVSKWKAIDWAMKIGDLFLPAPNQTMDLVGWNLIRNNLIQETGSDKSDKSYLRLDFDISTQDPKDKKLANIDDPTLFDRFVEVAHHYLEKGKINEHLPSEVGFDADSPREAIKQFIEANTPTNF